MSKVSAALTLSIALHAPPLLANGLIPGPGEAGHDAALAGKAALYDRQFHTFNASPFGLSLDAHLSDPGDRQAISDFLAQSAVTDFLAFTTAAGRPRTAEQVIAYRGEHGDLGMFAGVAATADAFRYMVLRDRGGTPAEIAAARADLLDAIAAFGAYANVTGTQGPIARGLRLATEPGSPPVPRPATCPDAWTRQDAWRADESGRFGGYLWLDNTSKDQMLGYVMAIGAFWDAIADDPDVPAQVKADLQADALGLGRSLSTPVEVRPGTLIDLAIRDAGGCLTRFHDLNPREVLLDNADPLVLQETSTTQNGFNALAALGIVRTLYHISGADELRTYYYDVLVAQRGYPALVTSGIARLRNMFINACPAGNCAVTNFSNVNMAFTAIYGLLRYETDPALQATYRAILQDELWDNSRPHVGVKIQQAFFNLIYAGLKEGATDAQQAASASAQLGAFVDPPYYQYAVENCDAAELAAGMCLGADGVTPIVIDDVPGRGGGVVAVDPVPKHIRPASNFEWRSDPRSVNGGAGDRLNPGGDFRAAYWMGRYLEHAPSGTANVSPIARNPDGTGGPRGVPAIDAGVADAAAPDAADPADAGPPADAGVDASQVDAAPGLDATAADAAGEDAAAADGGVPAADAAAIADTGAAVSTQPGEGCSCATAEPNVSWVLIAVAALLVLSRRRAR